MKFSQLTGASLLIAIVSSISTSNLFAQPSYYYPPPPPPGYMQNMPPPPAYMQNVPPPNFNRGYPPPNYGNNGYPPPYYRNNQGGFNRFSNGPFSNGPWNRFNNGWGNNNNYGPDTRWFTDTPRRWMRNGPKEGAGQVFDDFLDAPSRMGDMPGGWSAPTISVPNPIDVADELERGSQDMFNSN